MKPHLEQLFLDFCKAKCELESNLPSYTDTGLYFYLVTSINDVLTIECGEIDMKVNATFFYGGGKWHCAYPGGYTDRIDEIMKIIIDHFGE